MTSPAVSSSVASSNISAKSSLAYLLEYSTGQHVAFAPYVSQELIDCPEQVLVMPEMADYAFGLIEWRQRWLPMLDMAALSNNKAIDRQFLPKYCLILAYKSASGIKYGALAAYKVPDSIYVNDNDLCALPDDAEFWSTAAISCFRHQHRAVPILSTDMLFSQYHT